MQKAKKRPQTLTSEIEILKQAIVSGLAEKKGKEIVELNLSGIEEAVTQSFIICTGDSTTQVVALANSVVFEVEKLLNEKPWHIEGRANAQWVLVDFVDVVVDVLLKGYRQSYGIEELWNDAPRTEFTNL